MTHDCLAALKGGCHPFLRWQFACNGCWEKALHLHPRQPKMRECLRSWLEVAADDVAAELFFAGDAGELFLGLRFPPRKETQLFLAEVLIDLDLDVGSAEDSLARTVAALRSISGLEELYLGEPAFMEIGVVNGWKSFGPLRFWQGGSPSPLESLHLALQQGGCFEGPFPLPLALEGGFSVPVPHWVGLPVSSSTADGYRLDGLLAEEAVASLLR